MDRIERDGEDLDEVVMHGCIAHLERMSGRGFFLELTRPDGTSLAIWLSSARAIRTTDEEREAPKWWGGTPPWEKPA